MSIQIRPHHSKLPRDPRVKPQDPRSQCWGKVQYRYRKEAVEVMRATAPEGLTVYCCPWPTAGARYRRHWHVGHKPGWAKQQAAKKLAPEEIEALNQLRQRRGQGASSE